MSVLPQTAFELRRAVAEARAGWRTPAWLALAAIAIAAAIPFSRCRACVSTRWPTPPTLHLRRPRSG